MPTPRLLTINIEEIAIDNRLREETFGDISELADSLAFIGQLKPIRVRPVEGDKWELEDGERRIRAAEVLANSDRTIRGLEPGQILAMTDDEPIEGIGALMREYHANFHEQFNWREKAKYVRKVHDELKAQWDDWSVESTAAAINMSAPSIYKYLQLTEIEEIFAHPKVTKASSLTVAVKQSKIVRDQVRHEEAQKIRETRGETEPEKEKTQTDFGALASQLVQCADAVKWLQGWPEEFFDFIHWDPPYGGDQAGGALASFDKFEDSEDYAKDLMSRAFPEIHTALRDGGWLAIWYHPRHYEWLVTELKRHGFWVNPYPNIWYKVDRKADGHEITRFLINAHEEFLLAAKWEDEEPIIKQNDRQNVFVHEMVPRSERRHAAHKPVPLLMEVLAVISRAGTRGADLSFGSGSIFEAGFHSMRTILGCDLSETCFNAAHALVEGILTEKNIRSIDLSREIKEEEE